MPFGLYISVPFCRSKCTYCNFASGVFSATQMGRYVERLIEDMRGIRAYAAPLGTEIPETADLSIRKPRLSRGCIRGRRR
jgi:oxygen-independent coproporphyrinogen-3 oxidase